MRHEIVDLAGGDLTAAFDACMELLSEPLADSSLLPTYLVCRAARARMTVALGGDGADELFGGLSEFLCATLRPADAGVSQHSGAALVGVLHLLPPGRGYMNFRFRLAQLAHGFGHRTTRQSFLWMAPFGPYYMQGLFSADIARAPLAAGAFAPIDAAAIEAAGIGSIERLLHQFLLTYLPDDILMKTDRAAMFNSLEVRAPYLHRPLAEFAATLPATLQTPERLRQAHFESAGTALFARRPDRPQEARFAVPIGDLLRTSLRERAWTFCSPPAIPWHPGSTAARSKPHARPRICPGGATMGKRLWRSPSCFPSRPAANRVRTQHTVPSLAGYA